METKIAIDAIIDKIFDGFKKITPALVAVLLVSAIILFSPQSFLSKLGIVLNDKWRLVFGICFIVSITLILSILLFELFKYIKEALNKRARLIKLKNIYKNLSAKQKGIIFDLLNSEEKSIKLCQTDGDTVYLVERCFIFRPSQSLDALALYENVAIYAPQLWLLELYEKEPDFFRLDEVKL